jgi:COX assembly protein 2
MDALEECHRKEFLQKALGMCNFEKDEVAKCLHYVRTNDAKDKIRVSREKMKKQEEKRKCAEEELYGKNGYLKKVLAAEVARKGKE